MDGHDPKGAPASPTARELFGNIDVYLFDQILRERIVPGMTILDAGCGTGRNLHYFLREGYDTYALDPEPDRIEAVRSLAREIGRGPNTDPERYRVEALEDWTFPEQFAHTVICNAVLHFATSKDHFQAMLGGAWRPLGRGGVFFCRLASSIGIERTIQPKGDGVYRLPDGTNRYLVDEQSLLTLTESLGGELLDPIKTTNVQGLRCMTTWVVRKH